MRTEAARRTPDFAFALTLALALALVLSAGTAAARDTPPAGAAGAGPTAAVTTVAAAARSLAETVTAFGQVQADPDHVVSVTLPRGGLISRLWVRLGQRVAGGARLLELETAPAGRVAYQQAEAAVAYAQGEVDRLERLLGQQLATRDQVAAARKALHDAQSDLAAQAKLGTGQGSEVLMAPFDGIVTRLSVTQGDRVAADTTALLLARRDALVVPLGVEPEEAMRVRPGMAVILTPVFEPAASIAARVSEAHGMVDPGTRLVDVIVPVPAADAPALVLGGMMRGRIEVATVSALAVPRAAVLGDDGGRWVFVVAQGRARRVPVTAGLEADGWVAVEGDLKPGDRVVTEGSHELEDGMAVREGGP